MTKTEFCINEKMKDRRSVIAVYPRKRKFMSNENPVNTYRITFQRLTTVITFGPRFIDIIKFDDFYRLTFFSVISKMPGKAIKFYIICQ